MSGVDFSSTSGEGKLVSWDRIGHRCGRREGGGGGETCSRLGVDDFTLQDLDASVGGIHVLNASVIRPLGLGHLWKRALVIQP